MMRFFALALITLFTETVSGSDTRFTNLKCEDLDPSFCTFSQCNLKVLGRGKVALNVGIKLLKRVTNGKANLSFWRKYNGFRPYLFNRTFDFCKYMSKRNNKLSYEKIFLDGILENSNINHSCPYEDNMQVKELFLEEKHFKFFPLPSGEYQYRLIAIADNEPKIKLIVTLLRDEGLMKN